MEQIITTLLDQDTYKFSMGQAIYHQFPSYTTTWTFKCRNKDIKFTEEMRREIGRQIALYCTLSYTEEELDYLRTISWIKEDYIAFLRLWRPRIEDISIGDDNECGLAIEINGTWLNTSMYEVPILAIVSEVYYSMAYNRMALEVNFADRLSQKIRWLAESGVPLVFSEFGTRRRLSKSMQRIIIARLKKEYLGAARFVGTSNVAFARELGLTPVGTMAHEWIMCAGQGNFKHNPAYSNWYTLDAWVKEYGVLNGIALTDTIGTEVFLRDFRLTYATLFSGVRHDSGNPFVWANRMIEHYESLGIDPHTKTLLFSDSLDFEKACALTRAYEDKIKVAAGIGTFLSNDTKAGPLNIVMKVTKCNGEDVAKLSDCEGKGMCKNEEYVAHLREQINWRMKK